MRCDAMPPFDLRGRSLPRAVSGGRRARTHLCGGVRVWLRSQALVNIDELIAISDGIMVASRPLAFVQCGREYLRLLLAFFEA